GRLHLRGDPRRHRRGEPYLRPADRRDPAARTRPRGHAGNRRRLATAHLVAAGAVARPGRDAPALGSPRQGRQENAVKRPSLRRSVPALCALLLAAGCASQAAGSTAPPAPSPAAATPAAATTDCAPAGGAEFLCGVNNV